MYGARAYTQNNRSSRQDQATELITKYSPLVKKIALHLKARLPASVQVDDLIQSGLIGLLDAAQSFSDEKGASFETFASIRIRGAMIDEMRKGDWAPRSVYQNNRKISDAMQTLSSQLGRDATDTEIASHLGIPVEEYRTMLYDSSKTKMIGIEELGISDDVIVFANQNVEENTSYNNLVEQKYRIALGKAIETLPEKEALVLSLYYKEELNLKEIGLILDVSESRVSQILNQTIIRLRAKLKDWF